MTLSRFQATVSRWFYPCFLIAFIALIALWSFDAQRPSKEAYQHSSKQVFSQQNALAHLDNIATKPHFVGTNEHHRVGQYLIDELKKLGLEVEVFEAMGARYRRNFMAAKTANIVARIKGKNTGNALALVSHYDSSLHSSLGASDAGSGVVTIIEVMRAYLYKLQQHNGQPNNDIIIIFTDAEERGLLGAQAFVNGHRWAKDIKLALNFEARGSGGPSYVLLETNSGNQSLVEAFSQAGIEHPVANSLMYSIYKMLPNDTDLTVFREERNIQGLNFAFIDDHFDYHTEQDSVDRLDKASLNHQAEYLTALLDYFADADLTELKSDSDLVYFNFPQLGMVDYPFNWVWPMLLATAVLFTWLCVKAIKQTALNRTAIIQSFTALLLSVGVAGGFGLLGWQLLFNTVPQYAESSHGFTYNGHWLMACFIAFSLAVSAVIYRKIYSLNGSESSVVAPIVIWLLINATIAFYLPGAGFLIIPVVFACVSYWLCLRIKCTIRYGTVLRLLLLLFTVPTVAILAPLITSLVIGLGLKFLWLATVLSVLTFALIVPVFQTVTAQHNTPLKVVQWLLLASSLLSFVVAYLQLEYNLQRKKPSSINYLLDTQSDRAYWLTSNHRFDSFIEQFFSSPQSGDDWSQQLYPAYRSSKVRFYQSAPVIPVATAQVNATSIANTENRYNVTLSIKPQRSVNLLKLATNQPISIRDFRVNGQLFAHQQQPSSASFEQGFFFQYTVADPEQKVSLQMTIETKQPLELILYEISYDLYQQFQWITPRQSWLMAEPFIVNDAIITRQTLSLIEGRANN
ncbi:M28 family peptidase [Thalassotalea ponticola]|uniref:M28 family peptidase n=1 Tax=Thalassotalea ponticola TaxID=1523392 RepID=UPI0025B4B800|nr:M28 family peptidase [Thalassotalea ponticola]MDN3653283.1 M28 family peptidase [Thalassotalea ponticola]